MTLNCKGDVISKEAESLLKGSFFANLFRNKKDVSREAAELYERAANAYKLDKMWSKAGSAYVLAAEHFLISDSKHEAARKFSDASVAYQKIDADAAIKSLSRALEIHRDDGRFSVAAKDEKDIAAICESTGDLVAAAEHYQNAADYHEGEGQPANRDSCLLKVGHIAGMLSDYNKSIGIFEKVAESCAEDNLRKYKVREYMLISGICRLATMDTVAVRKAMEGYSVTSYEWNNCRESKFLSNLVESVENNDESQFTSFIREYDKLTKLDDWKLRILYKIKEQIKSISEQIC